MSLLQTSTNAPVVHARMELSAATWSTSTNVPAEWDMLDAIARLVSGELDE